MFRIKQLDNNRFNERINKVNNVFNDDALDRITACVNKIISESVDITVGYENWVSLGYSLASQGEQGRDLYHAVSSLNSEYCTKECDRQFDKCLKGYDASKTTIATFFHKCKEHGIEFTVPTVPTVSTAPIQKVGQLEKKKEESKIMRVRSANQRLKDAEGLPDMYPLFGTLWHTGEITILAADTGVGKTILSIGLADAITKGLDSYLGQEITKCNKLLYYDFELTDYNFNKRYSKYNFSNNLLFSDFNPVHVGDGEFDLKSIREDVITHNVSVIIIDNISAISLKSTADAEVSIGIMRELKKLQQEFNLSILVLAHVPKIPQGVPLNINHLAGSKQLSNFADSIFFIARSSEDNEHRYLVQKKSRNAAELDGCIVIEKYSKEDVLNFRFIKTDIESNHLGEKQDREEQREIIARYKREGMSIREIQQKTGFSKGTIERRLKE